MKKKLQIWLLALVITVALPLVGKCQGLPVDPDVPFDGGISLLIAAGVGIGAKKLHERRKAAEKKNAE